MREIIIAYDFQIFLSYIFYNAKNLLERREPCRRREEREKNYHSCFQLAFRFKAKIPAGRRYGCNGLYPTSRQAAVNYALLRWRKGPTPVDVARANKLYLWRRRRLRLRGRKETPASGKIRKGRCGERKEKKKRYGELYFVTSDRAVN